MIRRGAAYLTYCAVSLALAAAALGCSAKFLVPNPPSAATETPGTVDEETPRQVKEEPSKTPAALSDGVDFTGAFDDDDPPAATAAAPVSDGADTAFTEPSLRYPPFKMRKRPVRVMVRRGVRQAVIATPGTATVRTSDGKSATFRGRMQIDAAPGMNSAIATVNNVRRELRLPCTLDVSIGADGQLRLGDERYRGSLVITSDRETSGTLMIINLIDMEDYLRGVVPLEIGNLKMPDIEAVKAQAVAARTYAYQRMAMRAANEFDLVNTVSDQVYGGANAEGQAADMAIRLTKDLVMVHDERLINAYYHSTCGGVTANVEDVWGGAPQPYLRSVRDIRPDSSAYCGESRWFEWTENWSMAEMTNIIRRFAGDGRLRPTYRGAALCRLMVLDNFECGRVKTLQVSNNAGVFTTGGDRVRFLLRRTARTNPILRSSLITDITMTESNSIRITGRGHGHGIGMCQVGAIHRAREGQAFEQILGAYYSGVSIRTITN